MFETVEAPVSRITLGRGQQLAVGVLPAGAIADRFVIPRRKSRDGEGYQREVSKARVNKLKNDLKNGQVDIPTSILVNLRTFDPELNMIERGDGETLFIGPNEKLYVVDGQHRIEALAELIREEDGATWANYKIPVVCMLGASEDEEIRQFYVVNSTAKSVSTDLALDLLKQRVENEPSLRDALIESGEEWKVRAGEIVTALEEQSEVWKNRVRLPGDPAEGRTIGLAGLVGSLRVVLSTPFFGQLTVDRQTAILSAYWEGIRTVLPEVFSDPGDYAMQKSVGVQVLHTVLVNVVEQLRSSGKSVLDPASYAEVMTETLTRLSGEDRDGHEVGGATFWLVGKSGAAGSYSSNAGRRVLAAKIRSLLPELEVE